MVVDFFETFVTYQTARRHVLENDLNSYRRHNVKLLNTRKGMYVERNVVALSRNHYCHGNLTVVSFVLLLLLLLLLTCI